MRWQNCGRELESVYSHIKKIRKIYLFGVGREGAMVRHILEQRHGDLEVAGFVAQEESLWGGTYMGLPVCAPDQIPGEPRTAVVISYVSGFTKPIDSKLAQLGWRKNVNFFHYELFLPLLEAYRHGAWLLTSLCLLPTLRCNLSCRSCQSFTPRVEQHRDLPLESLLEQVDLLFSKADYLGRLRIRGGEPLLYPGLADLLRHLDAHYREQYYLVELVSNGCLRPEEELLSAMAGGKTVVLVEDYRDTLPQLAEEITANIGRWREALREERVVVRKWEQWFDLYPHPQPDLDAALLERKFDACHVPWQEYRDGKIHACHFAANAARAGILRGEPEGEAYPLKGHGPEDLFKAVEFCLGYNSKGYVDFCRHCSGYAAINPFRVRPGVQQP